MVEYSVEQQVDMLENVLFCMKDVEDWIKNLRAQEPARDELRYLDISWYNLKRELNKRMGMEIPSFKTHMGE